MFFTGLSLEEVDSVSELGAIAAAQQIWSHSTASTSLTTGGGSGGLKATPASMPSQSQSAAPQAPPPVPPTNPQAQPLGAIPVSSAAALFGGLKPTPSSAVQNGFRFPNNHGLIDMSQRRST